jgi:hypothetical protein
MMLSFMDVLQFHLCVGIWCCFRGLGHKFALVRGIGVSIRGYTMLSPLCRGMVPLVLGAL